MKQVIIITGGILSLTIILMIYVAIFMVTVIKDEPVEIGSEAGEMIQNTQITHALPAVSTVQEKQRYLSNGYSVVDNADNCNQLALKLEEVENSLANKSLSLPRSSIEQIFMIKNAFDTLSPSSTQTIDCEQAIKVINGLSQ